MRRIKRWVSSALRQAVRIPSVRKCNDSLHVDAAVCVPILDLVTKQLADISHEIEAKVVQSCSSLMGIVSETNEVVSMAKAATSGKSTDDEDLILKTRTVMEEMVAHIQESASFSSSTSERIQNVESELDVVMESLCGVTKLAEVAKIVALNGRIEAGRAGKAGEAFSVVAQETGTLARLAVSTNEQVCETVKALGELLNTTTSMIEEQRSSDTIKSNRFSESGNAIVEQLDQHNADVSTALNRLSDTSSSIGFEVSNTIVALQFQDAVNQRLGHIVEAINEIRDLLVPATNKVCPSLVAPRIEEWQTRISQAYTMDAERIVHGDSNEESTSADVELF
ncbi:MAG: hypothetical protein KDB27_10930 [Planctomycetales bacterium]|nr:hypothetical protein [Planctomycetales bacterium]